MPETDNSELIVKNPSTIEYTLAEFDNIKLVLRPIPIFICKEISKDLQPLLETINSAGRVATVIGKQIEKVQNQFIEKEIDSVKLMMEISALSENLQNSTPKDMDDRTSSAVIAVFAKLLKFYKYPQYSINDIEQKLTLSEVLIILEAQLELNGANDFLLTSLKFVMSIIKQAPKEMQELTDKLNKQ